MTRLAKALVALFVANALAVVVIWWVALETVDSLADWANAFGRITGLLGTYAVLVQLILRTHVPWLVTAFGKDPLKSWHTTNAYVSFGLLGAHGVLQLVGYALERGVDVVSELGLLIAYYDGVLLAIGGFLLLGVLTLLGLERYRHRIPWPTWRALHLYVYVAVALSVPHMLATGSDFIDAPLAVLYWTALELVVVAIIVAARGPAIWHAATALGRPQPAVAAVGGLVVALYLFGTIRFSPATSSASPTTAPRSAAPASTAAASTIRPAPSLPAGVATLAIEGEPIETPYGTMQVRVILTAGRITDVEPILLPHATKQSRTISNAAEYWLRKRAIAAQSAQFDVLSGATYTSRAYQQSLDSALRAAGQH